MNNLILRKTKLLFVFFVLCLFSLPSCKKDKAPASIVSNLFIGLWQIKSYDVKYYDASTGAEKENPGYSSYVVSGVIFREDGKYSSGSEQGTYTYDAATNVITTTNSAGAVQYAKVIKVTTHDLTTESSSTYNNTRSVMTKNYYK